MATQRRHPSTEPEKSVDPAQNHLTAVQSRTSTVDEAIDAEAGFTSDSPRSVVAVKSEDDDDPGPPPNGGAKAWLQVLGSFFLFFNCW